MKRVARPLPFVLASSGHGTLIVNRNDYRMINEREGYGVGYQIFENSLFDPLEVDMALDLLAIRRELFGDGVVAIDGGANIGVHTIEWASHMTGWGRVIAFEAQERVFYALAGNIAINNCFNAVAHYAALGGEEGHLVIPTVDYMQPSSFGSLELRKSTKNEFIGQEIDYSVEAGKKIRMMTIDGLGLARVDFIKLDIEGMELEGLAGAEKSILAHKPIMLIETLKTDVSALHRWLALHGYKFFPAGINLIAVHASDPSLSRLKFS